ncbi:MAG: cysteine hydrolase [Gordonia sp. (in: high G+C Gram-positive bacteria)]|nr:MAG: cysteine hydrolase [Gordonia sp. (in: high G+C Gram-positive bacteria)]
MNLNPATTAVIAVHLQPDIVSADGAFGEFFAAEAAARDIVGVTNSLLRDVRAAGATVVFTRVAFAAGYTNLFVNSALLGMVAQTHCLLEDSPSSQILPDIAVEDSDVVVVHQRAGGFSNSVLELVLRSRGIDTLVFIGVATNMSVEGTARQASDLGYRTIVVADACSAADETAHTSSLASLGLLAEIVTVDDVREALNVPAAVRAE